MRTRTTCLALGLALTLAGAANTQALDRSRYLPLADLRPGMTGVGKTTLEGTTVTEFQVRVLAVLRNVEPKHDRILVRASGAGLEESGVIAGMSGSPVYIDGRLIGAVAYAFRWCKVPIAGVQPIEQMLAVTDERPWAAPAGAPSGAAPLVSRKPKASAPGAGWPGSASFAPIEALDLCVAGPEPWAVAGPAGAADEGFAVPASIIPASDLPASAAGRGTYDLQPILTPVMVSGLTSRGLGRLRQALEPLGMAAMAGGQVDRALPVAARLEPGAPLAVVLIRGDVEAAAMGTITEIVGDRLYGFGHAMFGAGETDLPMMTGLAHVVIPSLMNSSRMGAPVAEVGRLVWDEQAAVLGRLSKERAPMIPLSVQVRGPGRVPDRTYRAEVVRHRRLSATLAAGASADCLLVHSALPPDHTVVYRVTVRAAGRPPIVRENLVASPDGDLHVANQVRSLVSLLMDNPFENLAVESVDVEMTVEAGTQRAEIQEVRALRNTVRPGDVLPLELKVRPWRREPEWRAVECGVPADYADGRYRVTLCGADEALRQEMREVPARFRPEDVDSLVETLRRNEPRDRLYVRLDQPGEGLAVGRDELPNLPPSMRQVLAGSARRQVSGVRLRRVTTIPVPYVLQGQADVEFAVHRHAPAP